MSRLMSDLMSRLMSRLKLDLLSRNYRMMRELRTKMSRLNAVVVVVIAVLVFPITQMNSIIRRW
jgi:hypothetical protein